MTEEGGVHGSQRVKYSAPGVITFCVVGDDMFGQGKSAVSHRGHLLGERSG